MPYLIPFIIALILILIGLLGIIIPFLPDMFFVFLGILIFAILTGFEKITLSFILIILLLTLFSYLFDWIGVTLGAKKSKASNVGIIGAILGALLGIFCGGLLGMVLFSLLGTTIFELIFAHKNLADSLKAGAGSVFGLFFSIILKFALAGIIIGLFLARIF